MVLTKHNHHSGDLDEIDVRDFHTAFNTEESDLILDQIALEADLCFGRNKYCTPYFKERYPVKKLLANMTDERIPKMFRASLVRLFTYIYIDDHPHSLMKMSRCFKAFESADDYLGDSHFERSPELTAEDLNNLFLYINNYFYAFAKEARGPSFVKAFELELVRCCKYMLKYGIFMYRNNTFQVHDIDDLFSFLCHILDIFTNRKDYIGLQSLDSIIQKDSIISDYTQNNPIQKAAFDIKYRLLNKKDWSNSLSGVEIGGVKETQGFRAAHIHSKIILEIMEIFHFMLDLRQNYLMSNIVEMFHDGVYKLQDGKDLAESERVREEAMRTMISEFKRVLPDAAEFTQHMSYSFPSVDQMYENKEFESYRKEVQSMDLNIDMHDNFLILLIDTFNVSRNDKYLQQMTLSIICRYYSERSELIRNIDRLTLLFDDNEWKFYSWVNKTIDQFTREIEKSKLWLIDIQEYDEDIVITKVNNYLFDIRAALYQKFSIEHDSNGGLTFNHHPGERKINKFAQRVFRSLKVYDHLINFIVQNTKLLNYVRTCDESKLGETERNKVMNIQKIFRRCFNILEGFTLGNNINQGLMWKYKEQFVFPDLGSAEEDGELEFVLAIIDGNERISTARSLNIFIQNLNKRMGHESNFVILLDIFNKLMDFESMGKIKKSLIKLILEHPEMLKANKKDSRAKFEASINVKEILYHILTNQELSYTRDSFVSLFPLDEFIERLDDSLKMLDELEQKEEDEDVDDQEYEELRESQQQVLIDLYCSLHLDKRRQDVKIDKVMNVFRNQIAPYYEKRLDYFIEEIDLSDRESYKLSQIKLLVLHFQILLKHVKECVESVYDKQLSRSGGSQNLMLTVDGSRKLVQNLDTKVAAFLEKLRASDNDDIKDLLDQILDKEPEDEENDGAGASVGKSLNTSNRINVINPEGSQTNMSIKMSQVVKRKSKKEKKAKNIKVKNRRSKTSIGFSKAWAYYVNKICNSRYVRDLSNEEQNAVSDFIYKSLTKNSTEEQDALNVYSLKKFIANTIDYACDCEKATWTVYLVVFVFKMLGSVLKKCEEALTNLERIDQITKYKINRNILDIMDTLRNTNYIFSVLAEPAEKNSFRDEVFMII